MKKIILVLAGLALTISAEAQNVPSGITGLWRFQSALSGGDATMAATIGVDAVNSNPPGNGHSFLGPWTDIGTVGSPTLYSDGGVLQDRSYDYITINPSFSANGGGSYVNQYSILWDVKPDPNWNSLYQTSADAHANDGDLWINAATQTAATIGVGGTEGVGYSTLTFDATKWHRIVLSVDNGNFFRVYVDGTLFLDAAGRTVDGRFALYPDQVHLFADDNWEDAWILCGTVATWNRPLTDEEAAGMGGWIDDASPTPLVMVVPEPSTLSLAILGGLVCLIKRMRK